MNTAKSLNRHCVFSAVAVFILSAFGAFSVTAYAQSSGPSVNVCTSGTVDYSNSIEQSVCLYGDDTGLDAYVYTEDDEYEDWGGGDFFVPAVGSDAQIYDGSTFVYDSGMVYGGTSVTATGSVIPNINDWYTLNGIYSECYDASGNGYSCNWDGGDWGWSVSAQVTPSISISSSNPAAATGTSVTFTASVNGGVTGTVTFYDWGSVIGTGSVSGGTATFITSSLATGGHAITASVSSLNSPTITQIMYEPGSIQIPAPGNIMTVAGNGTASYSGDGGNALLGEMYYPTGVAVDSYGNLYIADHNNHRIRRVGATTGDITTVAGNGTPGFSGDGGAATSAELNYPESVSVDTSGNLYIADLDNNRIREVSAATGEITTIAGTGTAGFSGDGGAATSAKINQPYGIAIDASGNIYFADYNNCRIRKISSSGTISTVAGNGICGYSGDGGSATNAKLYTPTDVAVDSSGNLYIVDYQNNRIRKVASASGLISTVAGGAGYGFGGDGGAATSARLNYPLAVTVDSLGNLFIADSGNERIREVAASTGVINTIAGNDSGGYSGDGGSATMAQLGGPFFLALDSAGNLYFADVSNERVRAVGAVGSPNALTVSIGGIPSSASLGGSFNVSYIYTGNGFPTESVVSTTPSVCTVSGNTVNFVGLGTCTLIPSATATAGNSAVSGPPQSFTVTISTHLTLTVSPGMTVPFGTYVQLIGSIGTNASGSNAATGTISFYDSGIFLGSGSVSAGQASISSTLEAGSHSIIAVYSGDGNFSTSSAATWPGTVTVNAMGATVLPAYNYINTVAGNGTAGFTDNIAAISAELYWPMAVAVDAGGNIYIADTANNRIRKVAASTGIITTVAGNGAGAGYGPGGQPPGNYCSGDNGPAIDASLLYPEGVAVDGYGNIYIADTLCVSVRVVYSSGTIPNISNPIVGDIYKIAGITENSGYNGDGIPATSAELAEPQGLALDASGNLYIADNFNNRIRVIYSSGTIPNVSNPIVGDIYTVAGTGNCCYNGDNQLATSAELSRPMGVAVDGYGDIYIADTNNNRVREVTASTGMISTVAGYGAQGYNGDNQLAIVAQLNIPEGIAVNSSGTTIYIADSRNNRIRQVTNGNITTVAGDGTQGYSGDGGLAINAELNTKAWGDSQYNNTYEYGTAGVAMDLSGNIYIADLLNNRIRTVGGQLTTSTFEPLYKVDSILYSPPGNQSNQGYGTAITNGTTTTVGSSFQSNTQVSYSSGVPDIFSLGGTVGYSQTYTNSSAFTETFNNTTAMTTGDNSSTTFNPNSSNAVNHNLDTFEIWLNPLVTVESNGSTPLTYTVNSTPITVNGVPLPFADIVGVPAITMEAAPAGVTALNPSGVAGITTVPETLLAPIRIAQNSGVDAYMPGVGAVCANNQLYQQELAADLVAEAAGTNRTDSYCTQGNQCGCTPNDFVGILLTNPLLFSNSTMLTITSVQGGTWGSTSSPDYYVLVTFSGNTPPVVNSTPNWYTFSGLTSYAALNGQTLGTATPSPLGASNPLPTPAANQAVFSFGSTVFGPTADTGQALLPGPVSPYAGTVSPLDADSLPTSSGPGSGPTACGLNTISTPANCRYVVVPEFGTNTPQTATANAVPQTEFMQGGISAPAITITDGTTTAETTGSSTGYSLTLAAGGGPKVFNLKVQNTWTWTDNQSVGNSYGTANSMSVLLKSSTATCNEEVSIYEDTVYHTLVFLVPNNITGCN